MVQTRPQFANFRRLPNTMKNIEKIDYKRDKCRWRAWSSNPGLQNCGFKRIHWATYFSYKVLQQNGSILL